MLLYLCEREENGVGVLLSFTVLLKVFWKERICNDLMYGKGSWGMVHGPWFRVHYSKDGSADEMFVFCFNVTWP